MNMNDNYTIANYKNYQILYFYTVQVSPRTGQCVDDAFLTIAADVQARLATEPSRKGEGEGFFLSDDYQYEAHTPNSEWKYSCCS